MKRRLKSARQYLKTDYKIHLERESPCPDHCRQFASSSSEPEFHGSRAHQHTVNCCDRCEDLKNVIADLQLAFDAEEVKFRWLYVFTVDTIWFPHNLRFVLEWHEKCMQMKSTICNWQSRMTWKITVNLSVISQRQERFFFFIFLNVYEMLENWTLFKVVFTDLFSTGTMKRIYQTIR